VSKCVKEKKEHTGKRKDVRRRNNEKDNLKWYKSKEKRENMSKCE